MTRKKRHHYVPRFYLNGFVDPHNEPYIWVYEKGDPQIIKATAKNIAVQKDYYSFITPKGDRDSETFKNILAGIEGRVSRIFRKIKNEENLNDQERRLFSVDNPLSYFDPMHDPKSFFGVGLFNKNVEVTFPISKDLMFLGMWKNFEGDKRLNNKSVKEMSRSNSLQNTQGIRIG